MFEKEIEDIVSISDIEYPFVSLYLDLSVDQHGKTHYDQFLKKRYKEIETTLSDKKRHLGYFNSIYAKIHDFLANSIKPDINGVAVFAVEKPPFFKSIQIPISFKNELKLGHVAYLSQLVSLSELAVKIATVVGDTKRAYIYISLLGEKISEKFIEGGVDFEQKTKQWATKVYERSGKSFGYSSDTTKKDRFEEKITNFYINDIITQLSRMRRNGKFEYILITGVKEFTELLRNNLPDELENLLIDVSSLDIKKKNDHELINFSEGIYLQFHDEQQRTHQKHLIEEILADGLAVAGIEPTILALTSGKIDTLIIGEGLDECGYICSNCSYLTASGKPDLCPICDSEVIEGDLKEMMINIAERYNCDVQVVSEIDEFIKMSRVGGILRFK